MKRHFSISVLAIIFAMSLQSCEIIGGIFKAGVTTGVIMVALVIALIIFLIFKMPRRK